MPSTLARRPKKLPAGPGVYLFKDKTGEIIYIGKSGHLKDRIRTYFQEGAKFQNAAKIKMIGEIANVETLETDSEIAALVKESELIKKHKPKFNVLMRDSKNYLYAAFTKEDFPKIILTHQPAKTNNLKLTTKNYVGPFTDAGALRTTLRFLRGIFPYCTCKQKHAVKCLNAHMGKCLAVCCLARPSDLVGLSKQQYARNIKAIKKILRGQSAGVLRDLKRTIAAAVKNQDYEAAQDLKVKINNLDEVLKHAAVLSPEPINIPPIFKDTTPNFSALGLMRPPQRIETYDISNIHGNEAVGSMIVFERKANGAYQPNKGQYRKFKIKTVSGANDPAMMAEIVKRRFQNDWPLPQLIIVDGGRTQLNAALKSLGKRKIRAVALAKKQEEMYMPEKNQPVRADLLGQSTKHLLQVLRDEAHRFAVSYHRLLRRRVALTPPRLGGAGLDDK